MTGSPNWRRFFHRDTAGATIAVAVSACLTGQAVRYDGGDRRLPLLAQRPDPKLQWLPVCPEVGAGLGVPRPPVQLVTDGSGAAPRALGRDDPALDVTASLLSYARRSAEQLLRLHPVCGYLWKSRSPSCGMGSTPLYDSGGHEIATVSGIQANYFRQTLPWLVFREECLLTDRVRLRRFALQCRLVFDFVYAGPATLANLHRHYRFLTGLLPAETQAQLSAAAAAAARQQYLTLLHAACDPLQDENLLDLFT